MVCVLTTVQFVPSGEIDPVTVEPARSTRTQYGRTAGVVPFAVLVARDPVSTRYSTVTGVAELALSDTGTFTVPAFSAAVALPLGKPTETEGVSSSVR